MTLTLVASRPKVVPVNDQVNTVGVSFAAVDVAAGLSRLDEFIIYFRMRNEIAVVAFSLFQSIEGIDVVELVQY